MTTDNQKIPAKSVDEYLAFLPEKSRIILENLRAAIRAAAPQAQEMISYRVPSYKYHGPLVFFVAQRNYCSFIVVSKSVLETFRSDLKPYDISGTTIHFSAENPLPASLVKKIVNARMKENEEQVKKQHLKNHSG